MHRQGGAWSHFSRLGWTTALNYTWGYELYETILQFIAFAYFYTLEIQEAVARNTEITDYSFLYF